MAFGLNVTHCHCFLQHSLRTLFHYLDDAKVFLFVKLHNLAHECDKHFGLTVTSWIVLIVLIWSAIYVVYSRVIGVILKRMALPGLYRNRLTESIWNSGFSISCIPLCITKLMGHIGRVENVFSVVLEKLFFTEQSIPTHILFSWIVICGFYVHNACLIGIKKGYEAEFLTKALLLLFLYTSYSLKFMWLGFTVVILSSICVLIIEFMRICYSLNRGKVVKTGCMRILTYILFAIHCVLWGGVFLYTFPQFYLLPAVNVKVSDENLVSLLTLNAALWSYFWLEVFCAPATKLIRYFVWPDYSYGQRDWLDYILFPPRNDVIQHLKRIRSTAQLQPFKSDFYQNGKEVDSELKRNRNSAALFQTVKCVMAMKRRIRKKRATKEQQNSSTSENPGTSKSSNEEYKPSE